MFVQTATGQVSIEQKGNKTQKLKIQKKNNKKKKKKKWKNPRWNHHREFSDFFIFFYFFILFFIFLYFELLYFVSFSIDICPVAVRTNILILFLSDDFLFHYPSYMRSFVNLEFTAFSSFLRIFFLYSFKNCWK